MQGYSKAADKSIYAYHDKLTLFDDQGVYNKVFRDPTEWFKLSVTNGNGIFERDGDNKRLNKILQRILYEVFVQEYRQHYIGKDTPELRDFILSSTTKSITSIKASIAHSVYKALITISLDNIFK